VLNGSTYPHSSILGRDRGLMNPRVEHGIFKNKNSGTRQKLGQQRYEGEAVLDMGSSV